MMHLEQNFAAGVGGAYQIVSSVPNVPACSMGRYPNLKANKKQIQKGLRQGWHFYSQAAPVSFPVKAEKPE